MLSLEPFGPAHWWTPVTFSTAVCLAGVSFIVILRFVRRDRYLGEVPGPVDSASWLYGNIIELFLTQPYGKYALQWEEKYGYTFRFKGCFSEDLLFTSDPTTIRYMLNEPKLFDYPPSESFLGDMILGPDSMVVARSDGDVHRRVKNAFSPAFAHSRLQLYVPAIRDVARKATDKLMQHYLDSSEDGSSETTIDIFPLLQHVSSDAIGEVGFGHKFNAVETDGGDKVSQSHRGLVLLTANRSKMAVLGDAVAARIPRTGLRLMLHLPTPAFRTIISFRKICRAWGVGLLRDYLESGDVPDAGAIGFVASANSSSKRDRLSFDEISQQTQTILVAGQETTGVALSWALLELAKRPEWQDKIRKEIGAARDVEGNLDKLMCLNAHIKESLRCFPPVLRNNRVAFEDTVLPLSEPITMTSGRVIDKLPIRKGQIIWMGFYSYNRNVRIWGHDANVFDPSRWLDGRYDSGINPGIGPYSNLATFGGGARSCLGWRLAILEMQVTLMELVSRFRFSVNPERERDIIPSYASGLLPLDAKSGKPSIPVVIQPTGST